MADDPPRASRPGPRRIRGDGALLGPWSVRDLLARMARWRMPWRWWAATLSPLAFLAAALAVAVGRRQPAQLERLRPLQRRAGARRRSRRTDRRLQHLRRRDRLARLRAAAAAAPLRRARRRAARHSDLGALASAVLLHCHHLPRLRPGRLRRLRLRPRLRLDRAHVALQRHGWQHPRRAVWHGLYNLATGTAAANWTIQAVTSAFVYVQAVLLVGLELRARRREKHRSSAPAQTRRHRSDGLPCRQRDARAGNRVGSFDRRKRRLGR